MELKDWEFSEEEINEAIRLVDVVKAYTKRTDLTIYRRSIAIDGALTLDRDDSIDIRHTKEHVILDVFVANPSALIDIRSVIDKAANKRKTSLYFPNGNYPMLPRELSEDVLSLNAGRLNPAIRIELKLSRKTGEIEGVFWEECLVEPENCTYDEISERIAKGDKKLIMWSKTAAWLRSIRQGKAKNTILPEYDPDSGRMKKEDGSVEFVPPHLVNSHYIVQEAMIFANHAAALLLRDSYLGVYRSQKHMKHGAMYSILPETHASIGLLYTHFTSPNRRLADILVHRLLKSSAGNHAYEKDQMVDILHGINLQNHNAKQLQKMGFREKSNHWLTKVFPDTDTQLLKEFDPIRFSELFRAAGVHGEMNGIFARDVLARIHNKGGPDETYGLVYPKDAITILFYGQKQGEPHHQLWKKMKRELLAKLAKDPNRLEEVFNDLMRKTEAKHHVPQASFVVKPQKGEVDTRYPLVASAVVAEIAGKSLSTKEFIIGFNEKSSRARAMIEFMRAYPDKLVEATELKLPSEEKLYIAKRLVRENVSKRKQELLDKGYDIKESERAFSSKDDAPRGYKYEVEITKDGKPIVSIIVKRDNLEEARIIGLETALISLRKKKHLDRSKYEYNGLTTFTASVKNGWFVKYDHPALLSPKQTSVTDEESWSRLLEIIENSDAKIMRHGRKGKSVKFEVPYAHRASGERKKIFDEVKDLVASIFPKITMLIALDSIIIDNAPTDLIAITKGITTSRSL